MAKARWTQFTPKPIVWDEVMYEGNITYGWGGLSGYTETRRAWTAFTNQVATWAPEFGGRIGFPKSTSSYFLSKWGVQIQYLFNQKPNTPF